MAHLEIAASIITFFALVLSWFALPATSSAEATVQTSDAIAGAV
jgi:hypothetical protein